MSGAPGFWGAVFERYGCDVLRYSCNPPLNSFVDSPRFLNKAKGQACDSVVTCGTSAVFVEMKGTTFSSKAKYSSEYESLREELDFKLVREQDGEPKAVHQLKRAVELAFNRERPEKIEGVDLRLVDTVFPLIVTRDDIGSAFGVNAYLQLMFDNAIDRRNVAAQVTPLFCMNVEEFERLSAYLPDISLTDLLHAHYRACRERGDYLMTSYFATPGNRILQRQGFRRPEITHKAWQSLTRLAIDHLGLEP